MAEITNFRGDVRVTEKEQLAEQAVDDLISVVGERVRKARESKGIPRRVLSEMSGVSPRYLAQLETGSGNISIGLLKRVALALDYKIEWFVGEEDPWDSDSIRIADMYRSATADVQQAVLRLLNPESRREQKASRICLIGLRGAGKSTLGRKAGRELGLPFVELNSAIEDQSGMPVSEVIALYGQEGYRKLEAQAIEQIVATYDNVILAVAGGIVSDPGTFNTLMHNFNTIWVKAAPDEHMSRVRAQGDERPMNGYPEAMEHLKSLLKSREAMYAQADAILDTTGKAEAQSLDELLSLIRDWNFAKV
ncbi:helix-turn-helix transcriptional regulator [Sneathiella glossodoripedis]|uniref:helix-turn-helix transcriptional regulator n=1 Tax=Sneathiella glossodoripedis TaxID=418853 RepID=UPI0004701840|nr:helix-turn-helix transcriptional regulator [Sneathiella glossodoripedis]